MGIRQTFKDFKRPTRIWLLVSFVAGILLLVAFSLTDLGVDVKLGSWDPKPNWLKQFNAEWFHNHAYIPNILAAVTGFLIGVPVALVVLATFTVEREDKAALDRVNKMTLLAWAKFRDSALELCNDDRIYQGLKHLPGSVSNVHDKIFAEYQRWIASAQTYLEAESRFRGITDTEIVEFQSFLRDNAEIMDKRLTTCLERVGAQHILQIKWSTIRTNWNTLSQYVRLQRLERNLSWLEDTSDALITDDLSENQNPLMEFLRLHESWSDKSPVSMAAALSTVRRDADRPPDKLREKLMSGYTKAGTSELVGWEYKSEFGWEKVEGHQDATLTAHTALWGLKQAIENVEKSGWPGNATQPASAD